MTSPAEISITERLLASPQYGLDLVSKHALLLPELGRLTEHHRNACDPYRRMLQTPAQEKPAPFPSIADVPWLPVRLFKLLKLQSIATTDVVKVLTSSGTTSQVTSQISVDRETSMLQTRALAAIVTSFIGPKRLPMIIVDAPSVAKKGGSLSARGAGLVGLSNFGRDHFFALDDDMRLNVEGLEQFVARHAGENILIFGFTFMVWQYFFKAAEAAGKTLSLEKAILIHSGGWKKLQDQAVTNEVFKESLRKQCGIQRVHNFYGMVEQIGGIYMECEEGRLHAPNMTEILIRDTRDLSVLPVGKSGWIQTLSVLPRSYPGHSILTEDLGVICGIDDCPCGRKGTSFKVLGRMPRAEMRGCSDVHAHEVVAAPAESGADVKRFFPGPAAFTNIEALLTEGFSGQDPLNPFDPLVIDFLDEFSSGILRHPSSRNFPDLVALAFWLRKSSIRSIVAEYQKSLGPYELSGPRGLAFHVAPSNVDTIFVYSWALAMLGGNINLVRISQTISPAVALLVEVLQKLGTDERWRPVTDRNRIVTFPRDEKINRYISSRSDIRVVWGGDETVRSIRAFPAKPGTKDVSFTDKLSYAAIQASRYLELDPAAIESAARAFFNDAYQFDQLACSSPHFVVFVGDPSACEAASKRFWEAVKNELQRRSHEEQPSTTFDKITLGYRLLAEGIASSWPGDRSAHGAAVVRAEPALLSRAREKQGGGFFVECFCQKLEELAPVFKAGDQTLAYLGYSRDEIKGLASAFCGHGIDRIVPVGQALAFGVVWDGYVLLGEMTRRISVL